MIEDTWIDGNPHLASKRKRSCVILLGFEVSGVPCHGVGGQSSNWRIQFCRALNVIWVRYDRIVGS